MLFTGLLTPSRPALSQKSFFDWSAVGINGWLIKATHRKSVNDYSVTSSGGYVAYSHRAVIEIR